MPRWPKKEKVEAKKEPLQGKMFEASSPIDLLPPTEPKRTLVLDTQVEISQYHISLTISPNWRY